jgi:broad specificity phosphatase PhoE
MLTKDIREKHPGWEIWKDGYVLSSVIHSVLELMVRCPDGDVPGESPQEMSDRVDRVIARIRKIHQEVPSYTIAPSNTTDNQAEDAADCPENADSADVMIFSHGHYTRCFIARWCAFDISAGYHFSADPGCVRLLFSRFSDSFRMKTDFQLAVLGYQHNTLKEPCECASKWRGLR